MKRLMKLFRSSIGLKIIMALTGAGLLGFVVVHMLGNLQIFLGQDAINNYASKLKATPALLWGTRFALLGMFVAHVGCALALTGKNTAARTDRYHYEKTVQASYASRSMLLTGLVVAGFIGLHLWHFTVQIPDPYHFKDMHDSAGRHDVYRMVVTAFSNVMFVAIYVVCNILLGLHVSHGATSLFQTLGLNHPKYELFIKGAGPGIATLIVIGNLSIPLACYLGLVTLPGGGV